MSKEFPMTNFPEKEVGDCCVGHVALTYGDYHGGCGRSISGGRMSMDGSWMVDGVPTTGRAGKKAAHGLMEVVGAGADEAFVLEGFDVVGFDGDDVIDVLEAAGDEEEGFLGDDEAEFFEEGRRDDRI